MHLAQWILQLLSGNPGASTSAKLDFIFLLFKLSYVMNGPLGDSEHIGTDLKNVLLGKKKIKKGGSICKMSQTQVIIRHL